ncbi:plastocyanin/azurin family copper-binding protein [Verrucomicrobia bacterium]|nr:plastocyanin/azurin family copper-binding protein [Verrucomicrobiota bacterium]
MERIILTLLVISPFVLSAQTPQWIWPDRAEKSETVYFRKVVELPAGKIKSAKLQATCDNGFSLFVNGKPALAGDNWNSNYSADIAKLLTAGPNVIAVEGRNQGGIAGFVAQLEIALDGKKTTIVTDTSWTATRTFYGQWKSGKGKDWAKTISTGKMGDGPWGNVFNGAARGSSTPGDGGAIKVAKGFKADLLYTVPKGEQGTWVAICADDKGRLIASDQGNKGLYRIDVSGEDPKVEKLNINISSAQGLLYAHGALWVNINGGGASGVHRLTDTNGDDQYDKDEHIMPLRAGGEHGPHALVLSPDQKHIYMVAGNMTPMPKEKFAHSRVPTNWGEDHLLKRLPDARGHASNIRAPGGWIARFDEDGKNWETFAMGFRNTYDMAFNVDGELFAYDSDMEWDAGTPWYRPTRFYHVTSGADFGWRTGTGKWPQWYPDCLPGAYGIGPGSPVGVVAGLGAKFPAKYQKAIYCLDWTYGTMSAMHLTAEGASYTAEREEFVASSQLRMTDAAINPKDGAMYFTVGGRGGQSTLYRVTYTGKESTAPVKAQSPHADLRKVRRNLESLHKRQDGAIKKVWPGAIEKAWRYLGHADRHIRWAARVALEHQPVTEWQGRALVETDLQASLTASCALARHGDASLQGKLITELGRIDWANLDPGQQAEFLRVYQLAFIRMGKPSEAIAAAVEKKLDAVYPAPLPAINRELCTLLVYLESPNVVSKTLALMSQSSDQSKHNWNPELLARNAGYARAFAATAASSPQRDQIHYAKELRNLKTHWTDAQRLEYFRWYRKAESFKGGNSFGGFLKNFRAEALANVPEKLKPAIAKIQSEPVNDGPDFKIDTRLTLGVAPQMKFDKTVLQVKVGAGVELAFTNNDPMPMMHNLVLVKPGAHLPIVADAAVMGADGMANSFVPESNQVLAYTPLVLPGNTYKLYFKAPTKPGKYEYICTYPGHGLTMWGILHVK